MRSLFITAAIATITLFSCKGSDKKAEKSSDNGNDQVAIRGLMDQYSQAFMKSDWDGLLELIHPGAFTVIPKSDFKKALESSFKGDGYEIHFKDMSVDSISPVIVNKSDKYSLVHITVSSGMTLKELAPSAICDEMKKDADVITCTTDSNTVNFSMRDRCYAIYVGEKKKWYFVSKGEESKEIVDKIIPKEVSEKLGY